MPSDERTPLSTGAPKFIGEINLEVQVIPVDDLGQHYGIRRFHAILLLVVTVIQWPSACVMAPAPYLLQEIQREFGVSNGAASFVGTAVMLGSALGVMCCGYWADQCGRRTSIAGMIVAISSVNLLHLVIPDGNHPYGFALLVGLRILLGIPYGGLLNIVTPYCIEFVSDSIRGCFATATNLAWPLASIYCIGCVKALENRADWRVCFAIAPLPPAVLSLMCLVYLPESPRWLCVTGRFRDCQIALDGIFESQPICGVCHVGKAPEVRLSTEGDIPEVSMLELLGDIFSPSLRKVMVISTLLYVMLAGGSNSFWVWGPAIAKYINDGKTLSLIYFQYAEFVGIIGTLVCMMCIDLGGRRPLIICSFILQAVIFIIFMGIPNWDIFVTLFLVRAFLDSCAWAVICAYIAEVFPTSLRGSACGFALMWGRLASVAFPLVVGEWMQPQWWHRVLVMFATLNFLGALLGAAIPREMAQCSMQDECHAPCSRRYKNV